ncbi:MAG: hypothetical protein SCK70_04920 [bacterium]|nr:hypothetical protein [bacterium]
MLRGGSWNNNANNCRVANRNRNNPDNSNNNNGFRVVQYSLNNRSQSPHERIIRSVLTVNPSGVIPVPRGQKEKKAGQG